MSRPRPSTGSEPGRAQTCPCGHRRLGCSTWVAMNEQVVCPGLPQSSGSLLFSEGTHSRPQGTREATAESTGAVHTMHPRGPCERRLWPAAGHAYPDPGRTQKPAEAGGSRKALPGSCFTARCNASVATVKRDEADGGRPVSGGGTVLGRPGPHARRLPSAPAPPAAASNSVAHLRSTCREPDRFQN